MGKLIDVLRDESPKFRLAVFFASNYLGCCRHRCRPGRFGDGSLSGSAWLSVTLLDRAAFPREKACGEYLTPGAVKLLRDEIGVLPRLLARRGGWR